MTRWDICALVCFAIALGTPVLAYLVAGLNGRFRRRS